MDAYGSFCKDLNNSRIISGFERLLGLIEDKSNEEINVEVVNAINYLISSTASKVLGRALISISEANKIGMTELRTHEVLRIEKTLSSMMEACYNEMSNENFSIMKGIKINVV